MSETSERRPGVRRTPRHRALSHRTETPLQSGACLVADAVLVVVFAVMGNRAHDSGLTVPDVWDTAGPFLLGLALSWFLAFSWGNPHRLWPTGVFVVLGTVVLGMLFRDALADGGVQVSFVAVALGTLTILLLGRRIASGLLVRRLLGR